MSEVVFRVNNIELAAQRWGRAGASPILALHGWLDNSASFEALAADLPDYDVLALDLAGHGRSDHRSLDSAYNIWQDVGEIKAVADQLGWQSFTLVGHSRGAMIATLFAGTYPGRVAQLYLIDGFVPDPVAPEDAPRQLARAIADREKNSRRERPVYQTLDAAARARQDAIGGLGLGAAMRLAERGTLRVAGGYQWTADPRLQGASEFKLTPEHIGGFIEAIRCPVHIVLGSRGITVMKNLVDELTPLNRSIRSLILEGGHHLHMEENAAGVAAVIRGNSDNPGYC